MKSRKPKPKPNLLKGLGEFDTHGGASILDGIDTSGIHLTRRRAGVLKDVVEDTVGPSKNGRKRKMSGARKSKKAKRSHTFEKKDTEGIDSDKLKDSNSEEDVKKISTSTNMNVVPETRHSGIVDSSISSAPEQKE